MSKEENDIIDEYIAQKKEHIPLAVKTGVCPWPKECQHREYCTKTYCNYDVCSNGYCYHFS